MKMKHPKGFSAIETALVVVFVILLAGTGWYVYKLRHKKAAATSSSTQTNSPTSTSATTPAAPTYLEVKEAKIKFQLSATISDAYYYSDPTDSSGKNTSFSTKTLDALNIASCKAQQLAGANAGILSGAATLAFDTGTGNSSAFKSNPNAVAIGNDWYAIESYSGCKSSDSATQAKIKAIQDAFVAASKTITSSQ